MNERRLTFGKKNPRKFKIIWSCALVIGLWWWLDPEWFEQAFRELWLFISFWAVIGWVVYWYYEEEQD